MKSDRPFPTSFLVKPAGPDCPLACEYCFYLKKSRLFPRDPVHRMRAETLKEMLRQIFESDSPEIHITWQGGEPTLMGIDFFREAFDLIDQMAAGRTVRQTFQTNGWLIDTDWAVFFRERNVLVGISLDGPQEIHDRYRKDRRGEGTWKRVRSAADLLLDAGVDVNALCCVTRSSASSPEELYSYFKETGLTWMQFIPVLETDPRNERKIAPFSVPASAYGRFLCRLFDLWRADFSAGLPSTHIRFFESLFFSYAGHENPDCEFRERCGGYLLVEHNGEVYPCDFFVDPQWRIGNLLETPLETLWRSVKRQRFGEMKSDTDRRCRICRWYRYCYGGCLKHRPQREGGSASRYCSAYSVLFAHADEEMRRMAREWKSKQKMAR